LLEIFSVLVVVIAVVAVDNRRVLIVDSRWSNLLHWPFQCVVLVKNLFTGQSDDFFVIARVGLIILRLVARRRHLFASSVYAWTFVSSLLFQSFFILPKNKTIYNFEAYVIIECERTGYNAFCECYLMILASMND